MEGSLPVAVAVVNGTGASSKSGRSEPAQDADKSSRHP